MNVDNVVASSLTADWRFSLFTFPMQKDKSGLKNTDSIDMGNTTWQTR